VTSKVLACLKRMYSMGPQEQWRWKIRGNQLIQVYLGKWLFKTICVCECTCTFVSTFV